MDVDSTLGALGELLDRTHLATSDQIPAVVSAAAARLGWSASIYVVDDEQLELIPFSADSSAPEAVESTLAGRAFRDVSPVASVRDGTPHLWVPLIDGVERLGVLDIEFPAHAVLDDADVQTQIRWFAHLTGHLVAGKAAYSDTYLQVRTRRRRTVASDLVWSLLPPLTTAADGLIISALLEPAHAVAGDAFDYAVDAEVAHVAMIDATGHDIHSGVIGAVALAAYRNARRQRLEPDEMAARVDDALIGLGADTYATGYFGRLDRGSGELIYTIAGHPSPLLLRQGKVVKALSDGRRTLFGLRPDQPSTGVERLEPGDWLILYTDGVTEARDDQRNFFGVDRFIDTVERSAAADRPAPETLRRIGRAILDHQHGVLQDDATILILEWKTQRELNLTAVPSSDAAGLTSSPLSNGGRR